MRYTRYDMVGPYSVHIRYVAVIDLLWYNVESI